jgi:hypothetical protein
MNEAQRLADLPSKPYINTGEVMYTITTYHKDTRTQSMAPIVKVHKFATLEAAKAAAESVFQKTGHIVGIESTSYA